MYAEGGAEEVVGMSNERILNTLRAPHISEKAARLAEKNQYVIEHYQQAPQTGDALAILTRSYIGLEQPKLAEQTRQVLALNYPSHPYLTDEKWPHAPSTLRKLVPFSGHH